MGVVVATGLSFVPPDIEITSMSSNTGLSKDIINIQGYNFDYVDSVKFDNGANCTVDLISLSEGNFIVPSNGNTGYVNVYGDFIQLTGLNPQPFWTMFEVSNFSPSESPSGEPIFLEGTNFNTLTGIDFQGPAILEDSDILYSGREGDSFFINGGKISGNSEAVFTQNININPEQTNTFVSKIKEFDVVSGYAYNVKFTNTPFSNVYENHILAFKTGIYSGLSIFNKILNSGNVNEYQTQKIDLPSIFESLNYQIYITFLSTGNLINNFNYFISGKDASGFYLNFQSGLPEPISGSFIAISGLTQYKINNTNFYSDSFDTLQGGFSYRKNLSTLTSQGFKYNNLYSPFLLTSISLSDEYASDNFIKNFIFSSGLSFNIIYNNYDSGIYTDLYSISEIIVISGGSGYNTGQQLILSDNSLLNTNYGVFEIDSVNLTGTGIPTGFVNSINIISSGIFTGNFSDLLNVTSGYIYNVSNLTNKFFDIDLNQVQNEAPYNINYLIIDNPQLNFNKFLYEDSGMFLQKVYFVAGQEEDVLTRIPANILNISGTSEGSGTFIIPRSKYHLNGPIIFKGLFDYERNDYGNFKEIPDPISVTPSGINTQGNLIISGRSFKKQNLIDGTGEYNSILVKFRNITQPKEKNNFYNTFYIIDDQTLSGYINLGSYLTGKYVIQSLTEDGGIYE